MDVSVTEARIPSTGDERDFGDQAEVQDEPVDAFVLNRSFGSVFYFDNTAKCVI
jgi:hypothetical protein